VSSGRPLWRRGFDRAERAVGGPLESLVSKRRFNDVLLVAFRTQRSLRRGFESQTRTVLHFWNLPTRTDVSRLRRDVGAMRAQLRELDARLAEQEQSRRRATRRPARGAGDGRTTTRPKARS
jgi:hypothetical protein